MSKKALLVGINEFPAGISALRGCLNDTLTMRGLLTTHFGFQDRSIRLLHNGDATGQGIRDGLGWLLSEYAGDGTDVRLFHFSSHGTYVTDDSDDEWDCRDEVIVTHDHHWNNPFRDDHLRQIFDKIPDHVNFTFVADCCHAGTIQKAWLDSGIEFEPRFVGPPPAIADEVQSALDHRDAEVDAWSAARLAQMLQQMPPDQWQEKILELLALLRGRFRENNYAMVPAGRHVLLAACEDRQTAADAALEGQWQGAFTWALSRALRDSNGDLTYDELITRAGNSLSQFEQRPQLECTQSLRNLKVLAPLNTGG